MRLVGEFKNEKQVFGFQSFLKKEGIQTVYDASGGVFRLWVVEEDDFDRAWAAYQEWQKNPGSDQYVPAPVKVEQAPPPPKWRVRHEVRRTSSFLFNNFIIALCTFLFIVNVFQQRNIFSQKGMVGIEEEFTPLEKRLMFDYPVFLINLEQFLDHNNVKTMEEIKQLTPEVQAEYQKVSNAPTWKGYVDLFVTHSWKDYDNLPPGTLFHNIREGQVWRLFTPVLLHGNLLHILFNMAWVWLLGRQIELRLGIFRYLILTLIIGIVANVAQYLASGPEFLGYSGIVMGMVGFIWMRQKMAPWEGYPLNPVVIRFLLIYIVALLGLEIVSLSLDYFHVTELYANIANTAHIIGGITGIALARIPFFSRSPR